MLPSPTHTHRHAHLDIPTSTHTLAVFAAHRATSCRFCHPPCRFLPPLPPRTRNVTLPIPANRLEFGIRVRSIADHHVKSGKNGNVDRASQHCHPRLPPAFRPGSVERIGTCPSGLPLAFMPGSVGSGLQAGARRERHLCRSAFPSSRHSTLPPTTLSPTDAGRFRGAALRRGFNLRPAGGRRGRGPSRHASIRRPVARSMPVAYNPVVGT
jgi:hypothetical protein